MTTKSEIKDMADRLISTLDSLMQVEKADAIVRDVAQELYNNVLGVKGKIVVDKSKPTGYIHGSFGGGKRGMAMAKYKFEVEK